jgi:hypothetical protein
MHNIHCESFHRLAHDLLVILVETLVLAMETPQDTLALAGLSGWPTARVVPRHEREGSR